MKRVFAIGLGLLGAVALWASGAHADEDLNRLSVDQVDQLVKAKNVSVYDNNGEESYASGHVPTAKLLSGEDMKAGDLPANKDSNLVFYCGGPKCNACHTAAHKAVAFGYRKVSIMPDGISGWVKAGKAVEKG